MSETTRITLSPISSTVGESYFFFVNDNNTLKQVDKTVLQNYFGKTWASLTGKPFTTLDTDVFSVVNNELTIPNDHTHTNKTTILDKFTLDTNDNLLFDGEEIGTTYTLSQATETALGGIKAKAKTTESVEVAIDTTTGKLYIPATSGVDFADIQNMLVEGDLIDIVSDTANETLTFNVKGKTITTYTNNTSYAVGDIVVYSTDLYQRITAGTDTVWTSTNWTKLTEGTNGQDGTNAYVHIKYSTAQPTQDSDMSDTPNNYMGIYSGTSSTAPTTYTSYSWFNIKGATGNTGSNGADGTSPTIDSTTKHWMIGLTDTEVCAEGKDGTKFYTGTDYPTSNLQDGDLYLSFATATLGNVYKYILSTTTWSLQGNIYGGGAEIDDTTASVSSCYSSTKTTTLINANKTTISSSLTLTVAGWDSTTKTQTLSDLTIDTTKLNTPLPSTTSLSDYASCGVYLSAETSTSLTFTCSTIPTSALTLNLKSEVIV